MKHTLAALGAAVALALTAVACSDPVAPDAVVPVAAKTTETFTAQLLVNGSNSHSFDVSQAGAIQVTLTAVTPGVTLGIGVGTPSSGLCQVVRSTIVVPGATAQLSGFSTVNGTLCLGVFDVGNMVEPVDYTVTVFHS